MVTSHKNVKTLIGKNRSPVRPAGIGDIKIKNPKIKTKSLLTCLRKPHNPTIANNKNGGQKTLNSGPTLPSSLPELKNKFLGEKYSR